MRASDVAAVYAGLLPIESDGLRDANVSFGKRAHVIDNAETDRLEGLITVVANRLTTARGVAERTVNMVFGKRGAQAPRCRTADTPLYGGDVTNIAKHTADVVHSLSPRVAPDIATRLARDYGSACREVVEVMTSVSDPASMCRRKVPSSVAPMRAIAARDRWLRASVFKHTRSQPRDSKACRSWSSFASVFTALR